MSMTFGCPSAPTTTQPCHLCRLEQEWYEDPSRKCVGYCDGTEQVSEAPEINWSNASARSILRLLGVEPDEYGEFTLEEMPHLMQRILAVSNQDSARSHLVAEPEDTQRTFMTNVDGMPTITTGARMVGFGNTDEDTLHRLTAFSRLLTWAIKNGHPVSWS